MISALFSSMLIWMLLYSIVQIIIFCMKQIDLTMFQLIKSNQIVHQIIPYCIQPLSSTDLHPSSSVMSENGKLISFDRLQTLSEQLYNQWSVPVDVAEEYELFLHQISVRKEYLYNCSSPYFGDRCQYKFGYINSSGTFPEIVESVFLSKKAINYMLIGMRSL